MEFINVVVLIVFDLGIIIETMMLMAQTVSMSPTLLTRTLYGIEEPGQLGHIMWQ
ncbi:MAG: hypothetical protein ABIG95_02385 [Candidatus Woesearchaeota archaeon]